MNKRISCYLFLLSVAFFFSCSKKGSPDAGNNIGSPPSSPALSEVTCYLSSADKSNLLTKQQSALSFGVLTNTLPTLVVDSTQAYQSVDGFGFTLTEGSAYVINQLNAVEKAALLNELFGSADNGISISYLRIGIGATDLSSSVYSYDDMPSGQTDVTLSNFSIARDMTDVIPLLKQILAINPGIHILATPWSPPVWMKDNNSFVGGSLLPQYYNVYAQYFVRYIQAMQLQGITVHAVTPQNEPLHPGNNPSMYMTAAQEAAFIKNNLGPAFNAAGINTKIIIYDHNCDRPDYPLDILNDAAAKQYVDGTAFHLYAGDISALSQVRSLHPDRNIYFTEQYTATTGNFGGDLRWHVKNVMIGAMRNWSKIALEWNLATDISYGPHTTGGCTTCLGAITVSPGNINRNVAYYIIAHVSKFVPANSVRINSDNYGTLLTVAFLRPDGKKVLIVLNDGSGTQSFNIKFKMKWFLATLSAGDVATYIW
jgi:glucosylceramidase